MEHLQLEPVPLDSRCGCVLCPDCRPGSPCGTCYGNCVVCKDIVQPGPRELVGSSWVAQSEEQRARYLVGGDRGRGSDHGHGVVAGMNPIAGLEPIHIAARDGNLDGVVAALSAGAGVDMTDHVEGRSALHYACAAGHINIVHYLVERGTMIPH